MNVKTRFYWVVALAMGALLVNAIIHTSKYNGRKSTKGRERFETLTPEQLFDQRDVVVKEFARAPKNNWEYFTVLAHSNGLIGSAQKLMYDLPESLSSADRDFRMDTRIRDIPISISGMQNDYANYLGKLISNQAEYQAALKWYESTGMDPLKQPPVFVPGGDQVLYWWFMLHVAGMMFASLHFAIRLRAQGLSIFQDVFGNPQFPIWTLFWEIGIFRYPMKVSPLEQLRRAQRWATLVISSVLPCFAAGGKICEEKPERAPQHQQYDGVLSRLSFSTTTASNYVGLDGAIFFPGIVQQSTVNLALPCGFYFNWFDSEPVTDRSLRPNFGREMDYMTGWSRAFGRYVFNTNATYINVFPLTKVPRGDVLQLTQRIAKNIPLGKRSAVAPYLWFREAMPIRGSTPIGGWFIHAGTTFSRSLNSRVSVSATAEALHDSGAFGYQPGYLGRAIVAMNWKQDRGVILQFPQILFTDPLSHTADGRGPTFSFGFGLAFSPGQ